VGDPRQSKYDLENDITKMCVVNWRQLGQGRDGKRREIKEELILLG
jgi:hypothetical protein